MTLQSRPEMRLSRSLTGTIGLVIACSLCVAQNPPSLSEPRLDFHENVLQISYDILSFAPEDKFSVDIDIRDEKGRVLNASALNGDIGKEIPGGNDKKITRNLASDSVYMRGYVSVTIHASLAPPPPPVVLVSAASDKATGEEMKAEDEAKPEEEMKAAGEETTHDRQEEDHSRVRLLFWERSSIARTGYNKRIGMPVRCVKD